MFKEFEGGNILLWFCQKRRHDWTSIVAELVLEVWVELEQMARTVFSQSQMRGRQALETVLTEARGKEKAEGTTLKDPLLLRSEDNK